MGRGMVCVYEFVPVQGDELVCVIFLSVWTSESMSWVCVYGCAILCFWAWEIEGHRGAAQQGSQVENKAWQHLYYDSVIMALHESIFFWAYRFFSEGIQIGFQKPFWICILQIQIRHSRSVIEKCTRGNINTINTKNWTISTP